MKTPGRYRTISSWGTRHNKKAVAHRLHEEKLPESLALVSDYIPYGNGRSYGDSAINEDVLETQSSNAILKFDVAKGVIQCQAGILLKDILEVIIPEGWFLPVTPGTKYISLGGAIAADVHGKNHLSSGTFSQHVNWVLLLLPDGTKVKCAANEKEELFRASCGGMGLTGTILKCELSLVSIASSFIDQQNFKAPKLANLFAKFESHKTSSYAVAWIDGFAKGEKLGKGIFFLGEHANTGGYPFKTKKQISVPKWFPSFLLNNFSMRLYNWRYFKKNKESKKRVTINTFFYPLDRLKNWNRIYGRKGFVQYQFVVPFDNAEEAIKTILEKVVTSDHRSYLTVLKRLGPQNANYLSFPLEGYTLAMDFKMKNGLLQLLEALDQIVSKYYGRIYLAKDCRMSRHFFEKGGYRLQEFKAVRKKHQLGQLQSFQSKRLGL